MFVWRLLPPQPVNKAAIDIHRTDLKSKRFSQRYNKAGRPFKFRTQKSMIQPQKHLFAAIGFQ